ncbi:MULTISPECIES: carbohydrate porin [Acidiphilium]|uniref:carbohydrate porin n=1 Tax=Acidiphilium TaxID=522 RepID=UPI0025873908|nr:MULTISPECIES: carbohydrate porin [Acidiphilium]HQT83550.1 carbohydrate porin [Acidiphilium rubrum]
MLPPASRQQRSHVGRWLLGTAALMAWVGGTASAIAQTDHGIWTRGTLLGSLGGLRTTLADDGITLAGTDTETLLGNVAGGIKQGATMQGLTTITLQIDTGKAFNMPNGTVDVSALQIHGRSLSPYYLDDLQTANGTEAEDSTRLWEVWYDQGFDYGRADFKIGQQSIDQDFIVSKYSALFVNTMAGWPLVPSADLYAGGPAYPLSSLGGRLQFKPADNQSLLLGAFNDNPPGGPFANDPQSRDAGGTRFNTNTGALIIGEFQYAINQPPLGGTVTPGHAHGKGLPGTYKIGFWYDTGSFPDQAGSAKGVLSTSSATSGLPSLRRHNYSFYAVMDQTVWISPIVATRTLNLFARIMGAPGDRNLIGFSFNGGATLTAPLRGRTGDTVGIDLGIGQVGSGAAASDRALRASRGDAYPVRSVETLIEATYQAQITPWWQIQPDIQYVINPGAGIPDPLAPGHKLGNELVIGIRANIAF